MVLERVVAKQIEEYFETNNLLGTFQFGFRKNKSSISELLTLFDSLLERKENKKEIMVILYMDVSIDGRRTLFHFFYI